MRTAPLHLPERTSHGIDRPLATRWIGKHDPLVLAPFPGPKAPASHRHFTGQPAIGAVLPANYRANSGLEFSHA